MPQHVPERVLIRFTTADGETREEHWPSVEQFRVWAECQPVRCRFTAYREDEDGDWLVVCHGAV